MLQSSGIAIATVHCILFIAGIVGNCLVCGIIKKHRDMRYVDTKITKISQPVRNTIGGLRNNFTYPVVHLGEL